MAALDKLKIGLYKNKHGYVRAKLISDKIDEAECYKILTMREAGQVSLWMDDDEWIAEDSNLGHPSPEFADRGCLLVLAWSDGTISIEKGVWSDNVGWMIDGKPITDEYTVTHWRWMPQLPKEYRNE